MSNLDIRSLSQSLQEIAVEQLHEEPEKIQEHLEAFRDWIKKSPHLKARTDDQFLVTFLRGCKYSMERAKQKLDMYYTLRTHMPEVIQNRDPLEARNLSVLKLGLTLPLPNTEHSGGPRFVLFRAGAFDPKKYTVQDLCKISIMITDIQTWEDDNLAVSGYIAVADLSNVTIHHLLQYAPLFIKKMIMMFQDGYPMRLKGIHYINAPVQFEKIFILVKSFLNEKLKSRIFVHSSMDSIYKVLPRSLMPTEYGGEAGSIASIAEEWEKKVISYRDEIIEDIAKYGVDEKKRPGRPKNSESLFGVDGSFRQLDFD